MCGMKEGGAEVGDGDEMSLSEAKREKEKGNLLGFFFLLILFLLILLLLLPFVIAGLCLSVLLSPFSSFHLVDWKERLSE